MTLEDWISTAHAQRATDLHLEAGVAARLRVDGELRSTGEAMTASALLELARELLGARFSELTERGSCDLSKTIHGVRCRINVLRSARGVGFAIRLLSTFQATLRKLNLHPDLKALIAPRNGLVLVTGPTGSGKTTTLSALLQEINTSQARHIITLESPIEYALVPKQSLIRQREVGRDTPSFEQGLLDALREDPDVLMVGEMRDPKTIQLTLNAAETGHLVLATMHSSTSAEALQRVVSAFPSEIQSSVAAQLADCLVGVLCQRLRYRANLGIRVPECELLMASTPVRSVVRQGSFFKLGSTLETGASDGSWSFARYSEWLARREDWVLPTPELVDDEPAAAARPVLPAVAKARPKPVPPRQPKPVSVSEPSEPSEPGRIEIEAEDDPEEILRELENDS